MDRVRIDKWLWAARFFKTRALSARACDLGRVQSNGADAKPARLVQTGDRLNINTGVTQYEIEILVLSEMRGPAAVAQTLYRETESSIERRRLAAEQRKLAPSFEPDHPGRPSKRNRRDLERFLRRGD
jgi:ribosome-associated heat shock protein Hsp15